MVKKADLLRVSRFSRCLNKSTFLATFHGVFGEINPGIGFLDIFYVDMYVTKKFLSRFWWVLSSFLSEVGLRIHPTICRSWIHAHENAALFRPKNDKSDVFGGWFGTKWVNFWGGTYPFLHRKWSKWSILFKKCRNGPKSMICRSWRSETPIFGKPSKRPI